jgi:hypothetical protein
MTISCLVGVPSDVDLDSSEGRRVATDMLRNGRAQLVPIIEESELMKRLKAVSLVVRKA